MPATFKNVKRFVDAELAGKIRVNSWRKTPSQATTAGTWFDLSMSPGRPVPKYWFDAPPLIAKAVTRSSDGGLEHGANVSPETKYLRLLEAKASAVTALPMHMILCDYLLYYPSIDDSNTDPQEMDNAVTLPRYTSGLGVQMVAISVAGRTGGQQFYVTYTNSDGVAGRTSQIVTQNAASTIGAIVTSATNVQASANPFIGLQSGDSGVRSVESVTMLGPDVGLFSIILVKPLGQIQLLETTPVEKDFYVDEISCPKIEDDAYLSFLCLPNGSLAATVLMGYQKVIWG